MKGFAEVTIKNRSYVIEYKGEHYVVRHRSGRVVRMAKVAIIKKFHLHHDALDRYIGGGFKKSRCYANEDVVLVKRSKNDVESVSFFATSAVVIACAVALIIAIVLGYVDRSTLRPYAVPMIYAACAAMFASVEVIEYLPESTMDFVQGVVREEQEK